MKTYQQFVAEALPQSAKMNSITDVATRNHPENVAPIKRQKYQRKNLSKMGSQNAQKTADMQQSQQKKRMTQIKNMPGN